MVRCEFFQELELICPLLTEQDFIDLSLAIDERNWIALSFVRSERQESVDLIFKDKSNNPSYRKNEKWEALKNLNKSLIL